MKKVSTTAAELTAIGEAFERAIYLALLDNWKEVCRIAEKCQTFICRCK